MRVLGEQEGFPRLPPVDIGLLRSRTPGNLVAEALAGHIVSSLDNLSMGYGQAAD
jgi:hypothetical protein